MKRESKEVLVSILSTLTCLLGAAIVILIDASTLEGLTILVITLASIYSMFYWLDEPKEN